MILRDYYEYYPHFLFFFLHYGVKCSKNLSFVGVKALVSKKFMTFYKMSLKLELFTTGQFSKGENVLLRSNSL